MIFKWICFKIDCLVNMIEYSDEAAWEVYVAAEIKNCKCYSSDDLKDSNVDQAVIFAGFRKAEVVPTMEEVNKIGSMKIQLGKHRFLA